MHSVQLCYGGDAGVGAAWLPLELVIGLSLWQQASRLWWDEGDVDVVVDVRWVVDVMWMAWEPCVQVGVALGPPDGIVVGGSCQGPLSRAVRPGEL